MQWGNVFLAIGFLMYGTSFTYDDFWGVMESATTAILNAVAIISIVVGTILKIKKNWKYIKRFFK